jgi:hypothetical protein
MGVFVGVIYALLLCSIKLVTSWGFRLSYAVKRLCIYYHILCILLCPQLGHMIWCEL